VIKFDKIARFYRKRIKLKIALSNNINFHIPFDIYYRFGNSSILIFDYYPFEAKKSYLNSPPDSSEESIAFVNIIFNNYLLNIITSWSLIKLYINIS